MSEFLPVPILPNRERFDLAQSVARQTWAGTGSITQSFAAFRMVWSAHGAGMAALGGWQSVAGFPVVFGTLPGTNFDLLKEVRDPAHNSAVSICLNWVCRQLPEPEFQVVVTRRDGTDEPIANHPVTTLLCNPNPHYDGDALLAATAKSYLVAGNAYWIIERDGMGRAARIYYAAHWEVSPRWGQDGRDFIVDYLYRPGGMGQGVAIPVEDVVHFRFDLNPYLGGRISNSPMYPILREVLADNEASTYMAMILRNMGIPGVLIGPKSNEHDAVIPKDARDQLEELWVQKFTGDRRGRPLVSSHALEATQLGITPEQLVLEKVRNVPEDRIAAAIGISPMVAGLTSGASHKTYANYQEARRAAYEDCIVPMMCRFALAIDRAILPDFPGAKTVRSRWDFKRVTGLQEHAKDVAERSVKLFAGGIVMRNEARQMINLEPVDDGDVFFDQIQMSNAKSLQEPVEPEDETEPEKDAEDEED